MTASKIEWTDEVWNPVTGCDKVSPGCDHCYAERVATRWKQPFIGAVELHEDRLNAPLHWRRPRRCFVNSVSDLFHPDVPDEFIGDVFAIMALAQQHTFQILTKRPQRMAALLGQDPQRDYGWHAEREGSIEIRTPRDREAAFAWPLPNVWLGTSVESQPYADLRIPYLLATPAAVRFLSVEPLLGPVDLWSPRYRQPDGGKGSAFAWGDGVRWVIVGGESGSGARPMHPAWVRSIREECAAAECPFFFKQWGQFVPDTLGRITVRGDGSVGENEPPYLADEVPMRRDRDAHTRVLDGRTWDEYPA